KKNEVGPFDSTLILRPRCYTLGIGCKKGTPIEKIELLVDCVLDEANISIKNVKKVASIDIKKEEKGLLDFCEKYVIPCVFFTAKELNILENEDFSSSQFVQSVTNVDCVCERAAVAASNDGKLIVKKTVLDGVTVAVVKETFRVNFTE
ncbi:MAG: cobalamin biosynthesis protein, partial [Candidatus Methanomethylophilaceae archaeon]|nr:cobalamin biosynthesis protein [Candidatus Methanomethylophilaceae archaeon]